MKSMILILAGILLNGRALAEGAPYRVELSLGAGASGEVIEPPNTNDATTVSILVDPVQAAAAPPGDVVTVRLDMHGSAKMGTDFQVIGAFPVEITENHDDSFFYYKFEMALYPSTGGAHVQILALPDNEDETVETLSIEIVDTTGAVVPPGIQAFGDVLIWDDGSYKIAIDPCSRFAREPMLSYPAKDSCFNVMLLPASYPGIHEVKFKISGSAALDADYTLSGDIESVDAATGELTMKLQGGQAKRLDLHPLADTAKEGMEYVDLEPIPKSLNLSLPESEIFNSTLGDSILIWDLVRVSFWDPTSGGVDNRKTIYEPPSSETQAIIKFGIVDPPEWDIWPLDVRVDLEGDAICGIDYDIIADYVTNNPCADGYLMFHFTGAPPANITVTAKANGQQEMKILKFLLADEPHTTGYSNMGLGITGFGGFGQDQTYQFHNFEVWIENSDPMPMAPMPDSDGDGLDDGIDPCSMQYGTGSGCPDTGGYTPPGYDTDGDGFGDEVDPCPNDFDVVDGCPDMGGATPPPDSDSDGDGVPDAIDPCPWDYGSGSGCPGMGGYTFPVYDTDGDGFPDDVDPCPWEYGVFSGCPEPVADPYIWDYDSDGDGLPDNIDPCPWEYDIVSGCAASYADPAAIGMGMDMYMYMGW